MSAVGVDEETVYSKSTALQVKCFDWVKKNGARYKARCFICL